MRSRFDEQLALLNKDLIEMGAMCEEVIALAAKALLDGDAVLLQLVAGVARAVVRKDDAVALHFVLNVKKSGR